MSNLPDFSYKQKPCATKARAFGENSFPKNDLLKHKCPKMTFLDKKLLIFKISPTSKSLVRLRHVPSAKIHFQKTTFLKINAPKPRFL